MSVSFNSDEYEDGFDPFVAGWANTVITDFGDDENNAKTGEYVWFEFTILDGDNKGRSFRSFYNYIHEKDNVQKIARGQLCSIARCVGVTDLVLPERLDAFKNKKLGINIAHKKGEDFPQIKEYSEFKSLETSFADLEDSPERDPFGA